MTPTPAPADLGRLFCDLVMKGGITSGVVYPSAIAELAKTYRLRNIGGASAGAIAAAGAAAAEYRRQTEPGNGMAGFDRLGQLATELGKPLSGGSSRAAPRHSRLFHLFAPTRLSRPVFSVLVSVLNRPSAKARLAFGLLALLRAFPGALLVGVALWGLSLVPVLGGGTAADSASSLGVLRSLLGALASLAALVAVTGFATVAVLAFALWRSVRHFARVMAEQEFGLCTGMRDEGAEGPPALTEWLYDLLQDIARKETVAPLTFGDLRRACFAETPGQDGIVLRMMTTCLTAGRPFTLPFSENRFYFDPAQLRRYFPGDVVAWMEEHPWSARDDEDAKADDLARAFEIDGAPRPLLPLPAPDDFPVIVAVRMSLSFPILLSAIPLYRYSVRKEPSGWAPYMERLCFTDGGVCSNLPIHLFDSPLPLWPTFAINLREDLPEGSLETERVVPPRRGRSYQGERYAISPAPTLKGTLSFLVAIVNTMQNWRDALQRSASGFKERVFTVRHTTAEGGMNLDMPPEAIDAMARSGALAAQAIVKTFRPPNATPPAEDDWHYHRWVRIRLLLPVLQDFLTALDQAARTRANEPTVQQLLTDSPPPMGRSFELNLTSRAAAWALLEQAGQEAQKLAATGADLERRSPRPQGTLRVTPTF
jgi:predicted acylesterase/phospholipase RssA